MSLEKVEQDQTEEVKKSEIFTESQESTNLDKAIDTLDEKKSSQRGSTIIFETPQIVNDQNQTIE